MNTSIVYIEGKQKKGQIEQEEAFSGATMPVTAWLRRIVWKTSHNQAEENINRIGMMLTAYLNKLDVRD